MKAVDFIVTLAFAVISVAINPAIEVREGNFNILLAEDKVRI